MAPPSLFDFVLSRDLADGVVIAGCAESACFNRLGVDWTKQRIAGTRDPYLRARVPRERIAMIWASALESRRVVMEITKFAREIGKLPRPKLRAPQTSSVPAQSGHGPALTEMGSAE
jgi:coenzyme F420-reducing hydrogenase delta subunit